MAPPTLTPMIKAVLLLMPPPPLLLGGEAPPVWSRMALRVEEGGTGRVQGLKAG